MAVAERQSQPHRFPTCLLQHSWLQNTNTSSSSARPGPPDGVSLAVAQAAWTLFGAKDTHSRRVWLRAWSHVREVYTLLTVSCSRKLPAAGPNSDKFHFSDHCSSLACKQQQNSVHLLCSDAEKCKKSVCVISCIVPWLRRTGQKVKMPTAPGIPKRSPIQVLTRPNVA